jgi:hypothetical protein
MWKENKTFNFQTINISVIKFKLKKFSENSLETSEYLDILRLALRILKCILCK